MILEYHRSNYLISTDKRRLNFNITHKFLTNSYWSPGIKLQSVKHAASNSICYGVYHYKIQIGYARVITDYVRFGYLADVFIIEEYRGKGLSKWLMKCILNNPELKNIKTWMLATRDAHGLYSKFGFTPLDQPKKYMIKKRVKKS